MNELNSAVAFEAIAEEGGGAALKTEKKKTRQVGGPYDKFKKMGRENLFSSNPSGSCSCSNGDLFLGPVLLTVYYSFYQYGNYRSAAANFQFVGLSNYIKMFSDKALLTSVINTVVFLLGCLVGQTLLGFFLALLMKNKRKGFAG